MTETSTIQDNINTQTSTRSTQLPQKRKLTYRKLPPDGVSTMTKQRSRPLVSTVKHTGITDFVLDSQRVNRLLLNGIYNGKNYKVHALTQSSI